MIRRLILAASLAIGTVAQAQPTPVAPLPVTNDQCWLQYHTDFLRYYDRYLAGEMTQAELLAIVDVLQQRLDDCLALPDWLTPCSGCSLLSSCQQCYNAKASCLWRDYLDGILSADELDAEMEILWHKLALCNGDLGLIPYPVFAY